MRGLIESLADQHAFGKVDGLGNHLCHPVAAPETIKTVSAKEWQYIFILDPWTGSGACCVVISQKGPSR